MREASLRVEMLDRQVVDSDDLPVARVDDLEIDVSGEGEPRVTRLLCGQEVLGERLGGLTGSLFARSARRLRARTGPEGGFAIEPADVDAWEPVVKLRSGIADLDAAPLEKWLGRRVIRHLPGASDAGE
jgi:hypothetical protein